MRRKAGAFTAVVLFFTACCTFILLGSSLKALNATAGIVHYPYFRIAATIDASKEMCTDWGWKATYEEGSDSDLTISSMDLNGKKVSINFKRSFVRSRVTIRTETGSEFTCSEIATELARRIAVPNEGMRRRTMHALTLMNLFGLAMLVNGSRR